jgi:ferredoxin-NADP reductase
MDRFIDAGHADLVGEMLWEIPLLVALHFLGVPEEDMATLRRYSIAHTVNTWGRPTPDEQVAVAEAVGNFWSYAGRVLERMRRDPSGDGWMEYAIRRQGELPDVITDSYLHSMMMAGIVAAHETTAHAAANALRLLLTDRKNWVRLCADPALIPNAVEECLRMAGSIVAWRRIVLKEIDVAGVTLPEGAKLLLVMASANRDPRRFEDPDTLDIFRDNTADHLTFGYGSHQCMGKNLARMELRIFLEEFTKRLPHMALEPDPAFEYQPNASFRGPEQLFVRWDPSRNPERANPAAGARETRFPIGAPVTRDLKRQVQIAAAHRETPEIRRIVLEPQDGGDLPAWTPGSHIDLCDGAVERKYSLCGDPRDRSRFEIAILREADGRGGSAHFHDIARAGASLAIRGPKNHFRLDETAADYVLVAGGIGITPIIAMADRLKALGKHYMLHYCGRSRKTLAFVDRLACDHAARCRLYPGDASRRLDISELVSDVPPAALVYACGPARLLDALQARPEIAARLHVEHFSSAAARLDAENEHAFVAELADSDISIPVRADQTLLDALRAAGVDVGSDCEEGLCGTCEVPVIDGDIDHRDTVLTASERAANRKIITCCSRARGDRLKLAL